MRLGGVVALFMSGAAALGGCGGSTKTVTVTSASSPPTNTTATTNTATSSSASPTTQTTQSTQTTETTATAVVHLATFRSPSGNIGCIVYSDGARCDIGKRSWSPPPRPASCTSQVDFGQGVGVGRTGAARIVCAGDTARDPTARALPYRTDSVSAGFRCQSRTDGVSCHNLHSGHGFFISFQTYRLF